VGNVAVSYAERKMLIQNLSILENFGEKCDDNYALFFNKSENEGRELERESKECAGFTLRHGSRAIKKDAAGLLDM